MSVEFIVRDTKLLKSIKVKLENEGLFVKPIYSENNAKVIKSSISDLNHPLVIEIGNRVDVEARICGSDNYEHNTRHSEHNSNSMMEFTKGFLRDRIKDNEVFLSRLLDHLPLKYTIYPPMVLFNNSTVRSFNHPVWQEAFQKKYVDPNEFYSKLLCFLSPRNPHDNTNSHFKGRLLTHLAINNPIIEADILRRPFNIQPLHGELIDKDVPNVDNDTLWENPSQEQLGSSIWCQVIQNGITQIWSPVFTMFSRGNIKEKKRILATFPDISQQRCGRFICGYRLFYF